MCPLGRHSGRSAGGNSLTNSETTSKYLRRRQGMNFLIKILPEVSASGIGNSGKPYAKPLFSAASGKDSHFFKVLRGCNFSSGNFNLPN